MLHIRNRKINHAVADGAKGPLHFLKRQTLIDGGGDGTSQSNIGSKFGTFLD